MIWGFAFSFQSIGGSSMGAFTFNAIRSLIGFIVVQPVVRIAYGKLRPDRATLCGGIFCGIALTLACNFQQMGLLYTSPGKSGFITASYMILVAIISVIMGKKTEKIILLAVVLGVVGLFFICVPDGESLTVNRGDILTLICALFYAIQILIIDSFGDRIEPVKMCGIQFLVCGILTTVLAFIFDEPNLAAIKGNIGSILYVGILSTGVAYSLQMVGMRELNPSVASLIMSLESVFSVLGEWLILGSTLSNKALIGCGIMFVAIILSQVSTFRKKES